MNYGNLPVYEIIPPILPEARIYFIFIVGVLIAAFFYHLRYAIYVRQNLIPPPELFWIREKFLRMKSR